MKKCCAVSLLCALLGCVLLCVQADPSLDAIGQADTNLPLLEADIKADSSDVEEPGKTAGLQHRTPAGSKAIFDVQSVAVGGDDIRTASRTKWHRWHAHHHHRPHIHVAAVVKSAVKAAKGAVQSLRDRWQNLYKVDIWRTKGHVCAEIKENAFRKLAGLNNKYHRDWKTRRNKNKQCCTCDPNEQNDVRRWFKTAAPKRAEKRLERCMQRACKGLDVCLQKRGWGSKYQIAPGADGWCSHAGAVHQDVPGCGRVCSDATHRGVKDKNIWAPIANVPCSECPDAQWPGCMSYNDKRNTVISKLANGVKKAAKKAKRAAKKAAKKTKRAAKKVKRAVKKAAKKDKRAAKKAAKRAKRAAKKHDNIVKRLQKLKFDDLVEVCKTGLLERIKETRAYGGNGGGAVKSYCLPGKYINYWRIRSGSLVDQIRGRCSNGQWLSKCGGNGGGSWSGSANTQKIAVRSGGGIDKFNGRGGNGGGKHKLDCERGFKISGYKMRCGELVDRVQFRCSGGPKTKLVDALPSKRDVDEAMELQWGGGATC